MNSALTLIRRLLIFCVLSFSHTTNASVVMTGTRVIFPSESAEKTIQFSNPDAQPVVVQLQITKEDGQPDNSGFFALVPPVFRMEPQSGQSVRLIHTDSPLPQDRESVFYLDFTQLPLLKVSQGSRNQLIIAVRSRIKIFYRPASLTGSPEEAYQSLVFSASDGKINIKNPSGFYIPVKNAKLTINGKIFNLVDMVTLSPEADARWPLPASIKTLHGATLKFVFVNDYGVDVEKDIRL